MPSYTSLVLAALLAPAALAHHTYAMYDGSVTRTVRGTVAKVEWRNPHVYLWMYVPRAQGGHDLYAFENASVPVLERAGWRRDLIPRGEIVAVEFSPLRDGRPGGHLLRLIRADGTVLPGVGGPQVAAGVLR